MKRFSAHALSFLVILACCAPSIAAAKSRHAPVSKPQPLPPLPDRNPERIVTPVTLTIATPTDGQPVGNQPDTGTVTGALPNQPAPLQGASATVTPQQDPATATTNVALPDRNASPGATANGTTLAKPKTDSATATTSVPLPDRNPKGPMLAIVPPPLTPGLALAMPVTPLAKPKLTAEGVSDVPLPDPNPNRATTATPFTLRGTLAPAIQAPPPPMDYVSILKPLVSYDISAADEANLRDVLKGGGATAAAKIQDPAVRDFALWYRYQSSGVNGSAQAIEQFRLAHPFWPGQDDLREKAEAALFLNDTSPDQVKSFFANSGPQTGAGKAALAGVSRNQGRVFG